MRENSTKLTFAFAGAALSVAVLIAAAWEEKPRAAASVVSTVPLPKASKAPALAFDSQQAFADFYAKQRAAARPSRPESQPGQPWSFNPPPGRLRPTIVDLNAHRTEF